MNKPVILVADDSPTHLFLLADPLRKNGYQVITATDGEDALEKARREHPDLLVLDVVMPRKNGFQVCRELKNPPHTSDIRVLMVSSKAEESDRFWGLKQGADEYLTRPFTADELVAKVDGLV